MRATRILFDKVTGEISITDDTWQANNVAGYYVLTGHWIEETSPGSGSSKRLFLASRVSTMLIMGASGSSTI
jgi:hypothetical protein